jgi:hypothetical protein
VLNTFNFSLKECECGITLNFPDPSGSLQKKEEYLIYFTVESSLPSEPPSSISLIPSSYVLSGTNSFVPKVISKVLSVHRGETQSLIKMSIKDRFGQTLFVDYVRLVCSPQTSITKTGFFPTGTNNVGPNGGSIMTIIRLAGEGSSTFDLDIGMVVTGGGLRTNPYIVGISNDEIELSQKIDSANATATPTNYVFTRTTSCVDPDILRRRETQQQYVILDSTNNWTYKSSDKVIIQFIRENMNDNSISVVVPAKNQSVLPTDSQKTDIPILAMVYANGRVNNDQYCIN